MEYLIIALLLFICILLFWFLKKPSPNNQQPLLELKELEHQKILTWHKEQHAQTADELRDLRESFMMERGRAIKAEEALKAQIIRQQQQDQYIQELQAKFKLEFENLANKILEEKTSRFTESNRLNLDQILNPFKENIKAFEQKVEKVYKEESDERNMLKGVISQLMLQSKQIQEDANNLTKALKGDNKKQGNWGEIILEKILERSGLIKDQEYRVQASFNHAESNRLQPDVIIDLPDNKHLVIDAKVSLIAYERLLNVDTEAERNLFIKQHVSSIKAHIQNLSSKNYQDLYQINSPDFVLLFIPIESSFGIAVQEDAELFNYAWDRKVVIVSPSTLLATLRTIASIWKQERQNRNVLEIARLSGSLYEKYLGFLTDMEVMGKSIRNSQESYDKAMNKLTLGSGNLTTTAEKIKKLGAKTNKQIDVKFLDPSLINE